MRSPENIVIEGKTLSQILIEHQYWLKENCEGWEKMRANLSKADLSGADLHGTDLTGAILYGANLSRADLHKAELSLADLSGADLYEANLTKANLNEANLYAADLSNADLRKADLNNADLRKADLNKAELNNVDLSYADLKYANLSGASLIDADLTAADLCGADLRGVDLSGVDLMEANLCSCNLEDSIGPLIEYRKGKILTEDIIGYKKCKDNVIVTLKIPRGATVFSINGCKCRTNKAKVIDIDGSCRDIAISDYKYMSYYIGDEITVYNFNCQYNIECAEGIHFFMTREEAERY